MTDTSTIPSRIQEKIQEYVQVRFRYDFLCDARRFQNSNGDVFYFVDIDDDEVTYHLTFDEKGHVVHEKSEKAAIKAF